MSSNTLNNEEEQFGSFDLEEGDNLDFKELMIEEQIEETNSKPLRTERIETRMLQTSGPNLARDLQITRNVKKKLHRRGVSGAFDYNDNKVSFQNSTMSFFNRKSKRYSSSFYDVNVKSKWLNNMQIEPTSYWNKLCFYMNSLYNNRTYKFKFIQYMGELNMMYEQSNKLMIEILETDKKEQHDNESMKDKGPLYFLHEVDDDISNSFRRIDVFLLRHLQFMTLCSAPVDMFMDNYYSARSNCCGLIEIVSDVLPSCNQFDKAVVEKTFYLHYSDCQDEDLKQEFLKDMENSYPIGCNRTYSTTRRIAALHNIMGELHAISEFIKTTVEMNDQLLFRLLMLFGSFLTVLGEYVWNTQMKQYHYE